LTRIRIHNPCNEYTRHYRQYNLFWDRLTEKLSELFDVDENRYHATANHGFTEVQLQDLAPVGLQESDYIIENLDNGEFCFISTADVLHGNVVREQDNPRLKKVLFASWGEDAMYENIKPHNLEKYSPWIHFQSGFTELDAFYYKRKYSPPKNKKLYFRGNINSRPVLQYFSPNLLTDTNLIGKTPEDYFDELIKYHVGLAVGGVAEFCYREVEYMAIGMPFIRFVYNNRLKVPLIPNVHYIAIDRPTDLPENKDRLGLKKHVELIEKRYLEVVDDKQFLQFISKNAREYYTKYIRYPNDVNLAIEYLGIYDWV